MVQAQETNTKLILRAIIKMRWTFYMNSRNLLQTLNLIVVNNHCSRNNQLLHYHRKHSRVWPYMLKVASKSHVTSNNWLWCRLWAQCQSSSCCGKLCRLFRAVVTMLIRVNQAIIMTAENRGNSHQLGSHAAELRLRQEAPCCSCR